MKLYKLVTFDSTGTLLKFRKPAGDLYAQIGEEFGIVCNSNMLTKQFKTEYAILNAKYPNFGLNHLLDWKDWWHILVTNTFRNASSCNISDTQLKCTEEKLVKLFNTSYCWELNGDVVYMLNCLRKNNIKLGVISNFDPSLHQLLKHMNIYGYFDFVICSYEAGCYKPDSRIFHLARKNAGLSPKDHAIHIGDNAYFDYEAAKNVNWDGCLLYNKDKNELLKEHPSVNLDFVFDNLESMHTHVFKPNFSVASN